MKSRPENADKAIRRSSARARTAGAGRRSWEPAMRKSLMTELDEIMEGPASAAEPAARANARVRDRGVPEEQAALLAPVRARAEGEASAAVVAEAILSLSKERAIQAELTMTSLSTAHAASCQSQERASRAVRWALRGWGLAAVFAAALIGGGWLVVNDRAHREASLASAKEDAARASKQALDLQHQLLAAVSGQSSAESSAGRLDERSKLGEETIAELRTRLAEVEGRFAAASNRAQTASEALAGATRASEELRRRVESAEARLTENQRVMLEAWSRLAMLTAGGPALMADGEAIGKELLELRQLLATANKPASVEGENAVAIDPAGLLQPTANAGASVEGEDPKN